MRSLTVDQVVLRGRHAKIVRTDRRREILGGRKLDRVALAARLGAVAGRECLTDTDDRLRDRRHRRRRLADTRQMSEQERGLGSEPIPVDEPEHRLIEHRQTLDRGRKPATRNDGAHVIDDQILDGVQHEARQAAASRIGPQPLEIVPQQGFADHLIGVIAVLGVAGAGQCPFDHAPHVVPEERLERRPAATGIEHQQVDGALQQEIAHHERHIDANARASIVILEPRKSVRAQTRHDLAECRLGIGCAARHAHAGGPDQIGERADQILRRPGGSPQGRRQQRFVRIKRCGHG